MISFHIRLANPWHKDDFLHFWEKTWLISKHKVIELEATKYSYNLLEVQFDLKFRTDHAGLNIVIGLFGYSAHFGLNDTRHWNYTTNAWEIYE
jgi:hypothetical protein